MELDNTTPFSLCVKTMFSVAPSHNPTMGEMCISQVLAWIDIEGSLPNYCQCKLI